ENNQYYADITIDNEVLKSLPQEGYIDDQLPQFQTIERYENEVMDIVDYLTLNEKQKKIFKRIEQHYEKAMFILPKWSDVDAINIDKLGSLNYLIAKILAVHTGDQEAKGLKSQLLLAK
ncbi:10685_t:CDS:2, partial [Racocetra fulgida]